MSKLMLVVVLLTGMALTVPDQTLRYMSPHLQSVGSGIKTIFDIKRVMPSFMQFGRR